MMGRWRLIGVHINHYHELRAMGNTYIGQGQ